ncbi:MAG: class II aldolase/adducin family protein [Acidimicrobiaceae bacterium]|nr:class II aldolase/adducin family protein [Acidimicrobiaceae bacterium]MCY4281160.1 class II aldolase/adducin family protein [Acidimicrobiaceae bacterium]MCY4294385.1 class II aldolase/adducin family protein [Acidimicrobiaceae bacterium]
MLEALREEVCAMNLELPANKLVVATGGNVSGRDPDSGCVVIKPSGVSFEALDPSSMVAVDPSGRVLEGALKPSVDLGIHLHIYEHRPDVFGIAHTHSPYATSFAARGEDLPAALTPLTHLIGGGVPCTRWATPAAEDTGAAIMEAVGDSGLAALADRHGVFTMGRSAGEALKVALHVEEAALTIRMAQLSGPVTALPDEEIQRCFAWYRESYGQ